MWQQVEAVLSRFQPLLIDGLWLELVDVSGGRVTLRLSGFHLCSTTLLSLQTGLEELFRGEIPDFSELRLLVERVM